MTFDPSATRGGSSAGDRDGGRIGQHALAIGTDWRGTERRDCRRHLGWARVPKDDEHAWPVLAGQAIAGCLTKPLQLLRQVDESGTAEAERQ